MKPSIDKMTSGHGEFIFIICDIKRTEKKRRRRERESER
jgi:hypothetical protein